MIGARGGEQQRFGSGHPAVTFGIEQQRADRLGARRAARLAGEHRFEAPRFQRLGQQPRLSGLAHPFPALQRHEPAGRRIAHQENMP